MWLKVLNIILMLPFFFVIWGISLNLFHVDSYECSAAQVLMLLTFLLYIGMAIFISIGNVMQWPLTISFLLLFLAFFWDRIR